jgi:hypothetical protein
LQFALNLCSSVPIHAELYTKPWTEQHKLSVVRMPRFDFVRIRATRFVDAGDAVASQHDGRVQLSTSKRVCFDGGGDRQRVFHEASGWAAISAGEINRACSGPRHSSFCGLCL